MKVTQVAIRPSEASAQAGRPALTPELLAASGARYSRNNEGLESILAKIDPSNLDKSVDSIFRMIDYGHQSIADMVPVSMFIDDVSIWLAYYIWTICPTAGGQESSTRYIKISSAGLIPPGDLGIPDDYAGEWRELMDECFRAYSEALALWENLATADPSLLGIPRSLLSDGSETAQKKVARMKRNYGFDRARYFLPVTAATNLMLVMSARGWVSLCQHLLSHFLPEANRLGQMIRAELELAAPRMVKHARDISSLRKGILQDFERLSAEANAITPLCLTSNEDNEAPVIPFLETLPPKGTTDADFAEDLAFHDNRYAWVGPSLHRTAVRFGWSAVSFAEIRDLNRHRTGSKHSPQIPQGFYCATDKLPDYLRKADPVRTILRQLASAGTSACAKEHALLRARKPWYVYWSVLGTQYPFEHTTTADKFIYEAELRTGVGAHFRYAQHLRDILALWRQQSPGTSTLILEGTAEPE
jgi:thymidylate synthase ThyX